jgi:hypothetical protein
MRRNRHALGGLSPSLGIKSLLFEVVDVPGPGPCRERSEINNCHLTTGRFANRNE